jgi:Calcineurin-like phosphoesterase
MVGKRKFREGITVVTVSLILLIAASFSLPNVITSAYANPHYGGVGDWGCGSNAKNTVKNIVNHNARYTLSLGDMSYQDTATCWFNIVKPLDNDADPNINKYIRITIGNHDDSPSSLLSSYKSHFHLNQLFYSVDREYVHLLVMNSEDPNRSDKNSAQYQFVKTDLEKAHANPAIKWIIVEAHEPFFSSPNGCSSSSCKGSKSFTQAYEQLFEINKVDLVLFGHVHNYQRTFPLQFNSADPLNPIKTTLSRCSYTDPGFPIYAIVGTGGNSFHSLQSKAEFVAVQQASRFGQLDLTWNDGGSKLTGQFLPNEAGTAGKCDSSSNILDKFTITKTFVTSTISTIGITGSNENKEQPSLSFVTGDPFT